MRGLSRSASFPVLPSLLPQEILELNAPVGCGIPVFDDDRSVERESPIFTGAFRNWPGPWHNDGVFRNDEWTIRTRGIHEGFHQVIDGRRSIQQRARAQHGASFNNRAFVYAAISSDHHFVLNDHGQPADRLQHATDLNTRGKVTVAPNLRAASDQRMRIDHGSFADVGSYVDEHGRHADHAATNVAAV